jgi:hypothetical protein
VELKSEGILNSMGKSNSFYVSVEMELLVVEFSG